MLASVSDYFHAMLTGDMLEAHQDHVDLKGVSASAVKSLLDFAYTGGWLILIYSVLRCSLIPRRIDTMFSVGSGTQWMCGRVPDIQSAGPGFESDLLLF